MNNNVHSIPISHSNSATIQFEMNPNMTNARWQPSNNTTMQNQQLIMNSSHRIPGMGANI